MPYYVANELSSGDFEVPTSVETFMADFDILRKGLLKAGKIKALPAPMDVSAACVVADPIWQ